tara:strand:+ start:817 stop:1557 length:741 start_codon:yes stop_codon:yes gene_type:complete
MSNIYVVSNNDYLNDTNHNDDDIYLVYQFFIHPIKERYDEIKFCLKKNIQLNIFKKIILLNERIYTKDELGLNDDEMNYIQQIDIKHRLKYNTIFTQVKLLKLDGYIAFCNADIFFDKSILNVRRSGLSTKRIIYTLLRFNYNENSESKLFSFARDNMPRHDSQDTWIYHTSKLNLTNDMLKDTDFQLGMPGCDNKITFIMCKNGYKCINEPYNIKTYHYHKTEIRNYSVRDVIKPPYVFIMPVIR